MTSIDNRVVSLTFDNAQFEREVKNTAKSLKDFEKNLGDIGAKNISNGLETATKQFSVLQTAGAIALGQLTASAVEFGVKFTANVIDKMANMGKGRALNIENAKFMLEGMGMDIEATMDSALSAVEGTAYGLDAAASAAARFGASGVKAGDEMKMALRSVAGVSAMTNSNFAEIADVFSEAASKGTVTGNTLARLNARSFNAAATISSALGITQEAAKEMASNGEISFLQFASIMDEAFGTHAQKANQTFQGAMSNINAALGRLGAAFQASKLNMLRDVFNALIPLVDGVKKGMQPLINGFAMLNAASALTAKWVIATFIGLDENGKAGKAFVDGLTFAFENITQAIASVYVQVKKLVDAFAFNVKNVFKSDLVTYFGQLSTVIRRVAESFIITEDVATGIGNIFGALLSIIRLVLTSVGSLVGVFGSLISGLMTGDKGLVKFLGRLAEYVTFIIWAVIESGMLTDVFGKIGKVLAVVGQGLGWLVGILATGVWKVFTGLLKGILNIFVLLSIPIRAVAGYLKKMFSDGSTAATAAVSAFNAIKDALMGIFQSAGFSSSAIDGIVARFGKIGEWIVSKLPSEDTIVKAFGSIGTFFTNLINTIGALLPGIDNGKTALQNLGDTALMVLSPLIWIVKSLGEGFLFLIQQIPKIGSLFSGITGPIGLAGDGLGKVGDGIWKVVTSVGNTIKSVWDAIAGFSNFIVSQISMAFSFINEGGIQRAIDKNFGRAVVVGIGVLMFKALSAFDNLGGGMIENVKNFFEDLKSAIPFMGGGGDDDGPGFVENMRSIARALLEMAVAVGILALAVWGLSKIGDVKGSIAWIGVMIAEITIAFVAIGKMLGSGAKFVAIGAAFMLISLSLLPLVAAVYMLGRMGDKKLEQGLWSLTSILGIFTLLFGLLSGFKVEGSDASGIGSAILKAAMGLVVVALAVMILGKMDVGALKQGIGAMMVISGVFLALFGVFALIGASGSDASGVGSAILKVSAGLVLVAATVMILGNMNPDALNRGLVAVGGIMLMFVSLIALFTVIDNLSKNGAAGAKIGGVLLAMSAAILVLSLALSILAAMDSNAVLKSALAISGLVVVLAIVAEFVQDAEKGFVGLLAIAVSAYLIAEGLSALAAMNVANILAAAIAISVLVGVMAFAAIALNGSETGIAGLIIMGVAILAVATALNILAQLSFGQIITSLLGLVAAMVLMGVVMVVLGAIGPIALLASLGLLALAAAALIFAGAAWLIAKALESMQGSFAEGSEAIIGIITTLIMFLPRLGMAVGQAILQMAIEFMNGVPTLMEAITLAITSVLQMIITLAPMFAQAGIVVVNALFDVLETAIPRMVTLAFNLIMSLLTALDTHMPEIVARGASIITNLLNGLAEAMPGIVDAAVNLIVSFVNAIGSPENVNRILGAGVTALGNFLTGLGNAIVTMTGSIAGFVVDLMAAIVGCTTEISAGAVDLFREILEQMLSNITQVAGAITDFVVGFIAAIAAEVLETTAGILDVAINFLNGLADVIETQGTELVDAGLRVAKALIDLFGYAFTQSTSLLGQLGTDIINGIINGVISMMGPLGWLGEQTIGHFRRGVEDAADIHSPSRLFYKIAQYIPMGMAKAFEDDTSVESSAGDLVDRTINTFQNALSNVDQILADMDGFDPVITPVLDLTAVQEEAKNLSGILGSPELDATLSSLNAKDISGLAAQTTETEQVQEPVVQNFEFKQTINSPDPLSTADIYNATHSQIKMAKEELMLV